MTVIKEEVFILTDSKKQGTGHTRQGHAGKQRGESGAEEMRGQMRAISLLWFPWERQGRAGGLRLASVNKYSGMWLHLKDVSSVTSSSISGNCPRGILSRHSKAPDMITDIRK